MADNESAIKKAELVLEKPVNIVRGVVGVAMRDGSLSALVREGIKDIQNAWLDAWAGNHDHSREPGTPGTPLFSDVEKAREFYRDAPSLIAAKTPAAEQTAQATVHVPTEKAAGQTEKQAEVTVHGPAEKAAGQTGNQAEVTVHGSAEKAAGQTEKQPEVTVHGPAEKAAGQTEKQPEVTVHDPTEKAARQKGDYSKVEFGEAWKQRVAERRENAEHDRKPEQEHGKEQAEQQQKRERHQSV